MPRRQPVRPAQGRPQLTTQQIPVETPPIDDPTYQALLKAENDAYLAWLQYRPDGKREDSKHSLSVLRGIYEERIGIRKAYQNKA